MEHPKIIILNPGETAIVKMADSPSEIPKFLSIKEACKQLKIHRTTLYRKERLGIIKLDRTNPKNPRISQIEIDNFKNK